MDTVSKLVARSLTDQPPPPERTRLQNHPTLLISWWCTGFALFLILLRLWGRWVRTDRFFREDKIMALSIIPLLIRMALVDPVMLFGTNSTTTLGMDARDIHYRSVGSRLVLASRIFYALFIWIAKFTVSEYLKRLTASIWTKRYDYVLMFIRVFLALTFLAVVISTLAECQPFNHYWQVVPDPGASCRAGYAQLITMGTCDGVTDILLIAFPIPIVWSARMPLVRKVSLCALFSLSIILIVITAYRVPAIINSHNNQQLRTLWASIEILAATAVSNALILGSFVRDKGVKKAKFTRQPSRNDSVQDQPTINRVMTQKHWGADSDEDLFSALRGRLDSIDDGTLSKPKPAVPARCGHTFRGGSSFDESSSEDAKYGRAFGGSSDFDDTRLYDIGGVLEEGPPETQPSSPESTKGLVNNAAPPSNEKLSSSPTNPLDVGGLLSSPVMSPPPRTRKLVEPKFPASVAVTDVSASTNAAKGPDHGQDIRATVLNVPTADKPPTYLLSQATRRHTHTPKKSLEISDAGGLLSAIPRLETSQASDHEELPNNVAELKDTGGLLSLESAEQKQNGKPPQSGDKPLPLDFEDIGNLLTSPEPPLSARHDFASRMTASQDRREKTRPKSEAEEMKCARDMLGKIKDVRKLPAEPMSPARRLQSRALSSSRAPGGSSVLRKHPVSPEFDVIDEAVEAQATEVKIVSPNRGVRVMSTLQGNSG
ncbi:MAG: hypothetical protein M1828_004925 [Chrysothrix sp. TS-e1954]|nr:MAG: hypothetical protein M1828_004925 [Chrysothrix sp. TS-e1954]